MAGLLRARGEQVEKGGLREAIVRGGAYLIMRKAAGIVVSLIGMFLLTGVLGAQDYGTYVIVAGIMVYLSDLSINGLNAYLVRETENADERVYRLAYTCILVFSSLIAAVGAALAYPLAEWFHKPELRGPFLLLLLALPINAWQVPAMAKLEKTLQFRRIAFIELLSQLAYYSVAITLAYLRFGVWAPVVGGLAQSIVVACAAASMAPFRPALYWDKSMFETMFKYGAGHMASTRIAGLRPLAVVFLVGRMLGSEAMAFLSLAARMVEALGFVNAAIQRVIFAVLSKVRQDPARLRTAMNEAMFAQVLALAPFMIVFSAAAPLLLRLIWSDEWSSVLTVYPVMMIMLVVSSIFSVHVNLLYVLGRNGTVLRFNLLQIVLFAGTAAWLVPRLGVYGYMLAELSSIVSYGLVHVPVERLVRIRYAEACGMAALCAPCLFFSYFPLPYSMWVFVPPVLVLALPALRDRIRRTGTEWLRFKTGVKRG